MKVSKVAERIQPSKGRALFNLASKYDDVINLTLGDPDIIPPVCVRQAGCNAIMEGKTRYSANAGLLELRNTYAELLYREYHKSFDPNREVLVTVGGMEALYLALLCSINQGDEVVIFSPYYINYYQMIEMCGGIPVVVETTEKDGFQPNIDSLSNYITDKSKAIIINSPNNPTGAIYSQKVIEDIIKMAKEKQLLLISDEVYNSLVYEGAKHYSVLHSDVDYENVLLVDSCSKKYCMTGWRVGFATGSETLISVMTKLQENIAACTPLPSQYAAIAAIKNNPDMSEYIFELEKRRNFMVDEINKCNKLSCSAPAGTFYLFVNISKTKMNSMDFAMDLLEKKHVAVVPGIAYGQQFDNYIRIAFTLEIEKLTIAVRKIKEYVDSLA